jgi:2-desacetyl-2-hydroxyethyl bacteriochlorophyllide A dehydrogenase
MKQAVMMAPETLVFRDIPIPVLTPDTVLIKIDAVGLCTWEQKYFHGVPDSYPFVGGHEISGTVVSIGKSVAQPLHEGDRVAVASLTRCGECYFCRKGLDNLCENVGAEVKPGPYWGPGGFSEYFLARGYEVFKIGKDVKPVVATLAEPLACVIRSIDRGSIDMRDTVLVLGAGVMGVLHVLLAKLRGARVIVSEVDEGRRGRALDFGADTVIDPISQNVSAAVREQTAGRGAEVVFFTAGGKAAIMEGMASLVQNGRLVIYGSTKGSDIIELDPKTFHYGEVFLTGVMKHTKDTFRRATELITSSTLPLDRLITRSYPFADILSAFIHSGRMDSYRIAVEM